MEVDCRRGPREVEVLRCNDEAVGEVMGIGEAGVWV